MMIFQNYPIHMQHQLKNQAESKLLLPKLLIYFYPIWY